MTLKSRILNQAPLQPDDKYLGKGIITPLGTWNYDSLILSTKPDIGAVDLSESIKINDQVLVQTGNQLATQINRTLNNIKAEHYLDDPDSIRIMKVGMKMDQSGNISQTMIQGRENPIIEVVSTGAVQISFEVTIFSKFKRTMPEKDVNKLYRLLNSGEPLTVSSRFLNYFGIDRIAVLSKSFPQSPSVHQQFATFTAVKIDLDDSIEAVMDNGNAVAANNSNFAHFI
jgi:hypothetical protein